MSASDATVRKVIDIVLKHVDKDTALRIIADLKEVPGNRSFRETIELLDIELRHGR